MPFLGNIPTSGYRRIVKQTITGNGGTDYDLDNAVNNENELEVFINNVRQEPGVAYTASGSSISFTTALESSDDCYIVFQGQANVTNLIESGNIADGSVTADKLDTRYAKMTESSTEPTGAVAGDLWFDNVYNVVKSYNGSKWEQMTNRFVAEGGIESEYTDGNNTYKVHTFTSSGVFETSGTVSVDYLIVGGGGSGGNSMDYSSTGAGGGGAGGYVSGTATIIANVYSIVVGAGGASKADQGRGNQGSTSSFNGITAIGGGAGGGNKLSGGSGGSGGGGSNGGGGGSGTSGQGFNGAGGLNSNDGGGGGGAGEAGNTDGYGQGGDGKQWLDGNYYAGGGAGGNVNSRAGGLGGGASSTANDAIGAPGAVNTGGGGCGVGPVDNAYSGAGGSGIVIIRYSI